MIDKPTQPTHWDWVRETRAIREGRTEPPAEDSLSFELAGQLAGELGAHRGDDPLNDRAEEAQEWCERIMLSEGRERLLAQYNSSGELWLLNRLEGRDRRLSGLATER